MLSQAIAQTREILDRSGVDAGHGIDHALDVLHHVENMISSSPTSEVPQQYHDAIRLAALLHDVDDKKFFPTHTNYENARLVLDSCSTDMQHTELILKMISLVSTRTHGNSAGDVKADEMWMLYPRFADRLEAIGEVGIQRALVYNDHVQTPMYTDASPMPITEAELSQVASSERFEGYMMARTPSD
eukprot:PhF_6_TR31730/c0_g1_i2/m.46701/K06950/K06950; uncharacterized protein